MHFHLAANIKWLSELAKFPPIFLSSNDTGNRQERGVNAQISHSDLTFSIQNTSSESVFVPLPEVSGNPPPRLAANLLRGQRQTSSEVSGRPQLTLAADLGRR